MLIERLKVSGLLSFGPQGIDLPLGNLNVLIGANGSGKSNFLEMFALLRAAPTRLATPIKAMGGITEWLWKGPGPTQEGLVEADVTGFQAGTPIRHSLVLAEHGGRFEVAQESIGRVFADRVIRGVELPYFYNYQRGNPVLWGPDSEIRHIDRENLKPEESMLSQIRDPERYRALNWLETKYEGIHLFRNWSFGPDAPQRREQSTHTRADFLMDGGENLALVLSKMRSRVKSALIESIQELYEGIEDFYVDINAGNALLYLQEVGGRNIPASRLSDGTLRYLCLLAILLHPEPPPLIAIEEPELGLHPDIIPQVAKLLVAASERTQLVVTTHSDTLVDALSSQPESVIVCEKHDGESQFRRLDADQLKDWLEKYTLGQLWSMGEIGATDGDDQAVRGGCGAAARPAVAVPPCLRQVLRVGRREEQAGGRAVRGRKEAFDNFCRAMKSAGADKLPLLLVDAETAFEGTHTVWQHLKARDGWDMPAGAGDDHAFLMVQVMESWFLADPVALRQSFGSHFSNTPFRAWPALEAVPKQTVYEVLEKATTDCKQAIARAKFRSRFSPAWIQPGWKRRARTPKRFCNASGACDV